MAIMVPEAAEAVSAGGAAVERAAARPKVINATYTSRTEAPPRRAAPRQRARPQVGVQVPSRRGRGRGGRVPGNRQYQGAILAEFLAATLIVAIAPLAKGGSAAAQAKNSPSPYSVNNMKQLLAIGVAYFVLALLSSGKHGRLAAWFGGLVLVGIGLSETATGGLAAIFNMFGPDPGTAADNAALQSIVAQAEQNFNAAGLAAEGVGARATTQQVGYQGTAPGPYSNTVDLSGGGQQAVGGP